MYASALVEIHDSDADKGLLSARAVDAAKGRAPSHSRQHRQLACNDPVFVFASPRHAVLSEGDLSLLATSPSGSLRVRRLKSCSDLSRMSSSRIPPISADPVPFLRLQKQCRVGAGFPASPGNVFRRMGLACS